MDTKNPIGRAGAQSIVGLFGIALVAIAVRADDSWVRSHVVLPNWFLPPVTLRGFHAARVAGVLLGLLLLVVLGPKVGRWAGAQPWPQLFGSAARIALALALALVTAELMVRRWDSREPVWRKGKLEFRIGRPDPRLGWVLVPSRATLLKNGRAKAVHYRIDAWGDRARSEAASPDPSLPTLIVSGESIAFGHALEYEETFAAILGDRLDVQVVNVGVGGYGSDQAYLRFVDALARLDKPVAVLTVFLPVQLGRDLQDYRPRLVLSNGELEQVPAASGVWSHTRLRDLLFNELPYVSDASLSRTMALNKAIVQATTRASRARRAEPLFIIPSFGQPRTLAEHPEAFIVRELFQEQNLPYLLIDIDPARLIIDEWHPDVIAARQIADEVERALRPRLAR